MVAAQRQIKEKDVQLDIKITELEIRDEQIKAQKGGNDENLILFK